MNTLLSKCNNVNEMYTVSNFCVISDQTTFKMGYLTSNYKNINPVPLWAPHWTLLWSNRQLESNRVKILQSLFLENFVFFCQLCLSSDVLRHQLLLRRNSIINASKNYYSQQKFLEKNYIENSLKKHLYLIAITISINFFITKKSVTILHLF